MADRKPRNGNRRKNQRTNRKWQKFCPTRLACVDALEYIGVWKSLESDARCPSVIGKRLLLTCATCRLSRRRRIYACGVKTLRFSSSYNRLEPSMCHMAVEQATSYLCSHGETLRFSSSYNRLQQTSFFSIKM